MQNTLWSNRPDSFRNASPRSPSLEKEIHILLSTFGFDGGTAFPFAMLWICPWISGLSTTQGSQVWSQILTIEICIFSTHANWTSAARAAFTWKRCYTENQEIWFDRICNDVMLHPAWMRRVIHQKGQEAKQSLRKETKQLNSIHPGKFGENLSPRLHDPRRIDIFLSVQTSHRALQVIIDHVYCVADLNAQRCRRIIWIQQSHSHLQACL